jgi:branched-subunit amino acid transport protein
MMKSAFAVNAILGMAAVTILLRAAPFFALLI